MRGKREQEVGRKVWAATGFTPEREEANVFKTWNSEGKGSLQVQEVDAIREEGLKETKLSPN